MNNTKFYIGMALIALALIGLSLVWPQGLGTPSPKPFGHALVLPDYFRMVKERDARLKREADEKARNKADAAQSTSSASAN